jgi:transcriptional regulator GlxA family with amidase domain
MNTPTGSLFNIGILVYPGCVMSSVVGPADVFNIANTLAMHRYGQRPVHFRTHWVSARESTSATVSGLTVALAPIGSVALDALLVPGVDHHRPGDLTQYIAALAPEQEALRVFAAGGGVVAATCSGTCLLASTGLMDGRRSTTSWWLSSYFQKKYPKVQLDAEDLLVEDGQFLSAGGATSYLDLVLALIDHFGDSDLRQVTSKVLVMENNRSSQSPYVAAVLMREDKHGIVARARRWLNQHLDQPWSMAELAAHCHTSQRTLLRRFQDEAGMSPVQYAQQLRIERAKALLDSTKLSFEEITQRCGYADVSTFGKTFKRWVQLTPREYRQRFGLRG